eukprot:962264-Amphidinium_carterae.1
MQDPSLVRNETLVLQRRVHLAQLVSECIRPPSGKTAVDMLQKHIDELEPQARPPEKGAQPPTDVAQQGRASSGERVRVGVAPPSKSYKQLTTLSGLNVDI